MSGCPKRVHFGTLLSDLCNCRQFIHRLAHTNARSPQKEHPIWMQKTQFKSMIFAYAHSKMHVNAQVHACVHAFVHSKAHVHATRTCMHACMHVHSKAHVHAHVQAYMHAYVHSKVHVNAQRRGMHTCMHMCMQILLQNNVSNISLYICKFCLQTSNMYNEILIC